MSQYDTQRLFDSPSVIQRRTESKKLIYSRSAPTSDLHTLLTIGTTVDELQSTTANMQSDIQTLGDTVKGLAGQLTIIANAITTPGSAPNETFVSMLINTTAAGVEQAAITKLVNQRLNKRLNTDQEGGRGSKCGGRGTRDPPGGGGGTDETRAQTSASWARRTLGGPPRAREAQAAPEQAQEQVEGQVQQEQCREHHPQQRHASARRADSGRKPRTCTPTRMPRYLITSKRSRLLRLLRERRPCSRRMQHAERCTLAMGHVGTCLFL